MFRDRNLNGWRIATVGLFFFGLVLFALLLVELNPGFGVVQMSILLLGLTAVTSAAFLHMWSQRRHQPRESLQASIGIRLAATGLVFAYASGLSDLISIGTHVQPRFPLPFVGWLQVTGISIGVLSIVVGMLLYHTSRGTRASSSLEFLLPEES